MGEAAKLDRGKLLLTAIGNLIEEAQSIGFDRTRRILCETQIGAAEDLLQRLDRAAEALRFGEGDRRERTAPRPRGHKPFRYAEPAASISWRGLHLHRKALDRMDPDLWQRARVRIVEKPSHGIPLRLRVEATGADDPAAFDIVPDPDGRRSVTIRCTGYLRDQGVKIHQTGIPLVWPSCDPSTVFEFGPIVRRGDEPATRKAAKEPMTVECITVNAAAWRRIAENGGRR